MKRAGVIREFSLSKGVVTQNASTWISKNKRISITRLNLARFYKIFSLVMGQETLIFLIALLRKIRGLHTLFNFCRPEKIPLSEDILKILYFWLVMPWESCLPLQNSISSRAHTNSSQATLQNSLAPKYRSNNHKLLFQPVSDRSSYLFILQCTFSNFILKLKSMIARFG